MKFLLFLGLTIAFARIFFEFVDGQIPLPMPFPGLFPMPGLAPMIKPFRMRWPTLHKRTAHSAEHSSPNPEEIRSDSSKTTVDEATNTVAEETTVTQESTVTQETTVTQEKPLFRKTTSVLNTKDGWPSQIYVFE